jgi:hypothetical protein
VTALFKQALREELRIKDARLAKIDPRRRPYYPPVERMAVLALKAARRWSLAQTARVFLVEPETIAAWLKRIDKAGSSALVRLPEPVNEFPEFVRHIVQRLKTLCPVLGKVKIPQVLARAGLHLCATTVGRMLKSKTLLKTTDVVVGEAEDMQPSGIVTAKEMTCRTAALTFLPQPEGRRMVETS